MNAYTNIRTEHVNNYYKWHGIKTATCLVAEHVTIKDTKLHWKKKANAKYDSNKTAMSALIPLKYVRPWFLNAY